VAFPDHLPAAFPLSELLLAAFGVSFALSLIFVLTKRFHGRFSFDRAEGVQRFHEEPTPRIGGLALILGISLSTAMILRNAGPEQSALYGFIWPVLLAAIPAFLVGFAEDLTKQVNATPRLVATMVSAVAAWALTGVSLQYLQVPGLDLLLAYAWISVPLTAFAVGGIANALNIIDGFHGLASGVATIICLSIGAIALDAGDLELAMFCALVAAALFGFLLVNFPFGKLFLGDGGAYFVGFLVGWLAVLLPMRNSEVSPWASLLICAYPVAETLFSIYRRLKDRLHILEPDREHMHSLVKVVLVRPHLSHWSANVRNAAVSPILWVLAAIPAVFAISSYDSLGPLFAGFLIFCAFYWFIYRLLKSRLSDSID
jgi:UDP-N-acetylmuramyl pentapeptide phosphotransferase/UDP-N-acetylglucosamine-1-phosphate transferase